MVASAEFQSGSSEYLDYNSASTGPHNDITNYPFTICGWVKRRQSVTGAGTLVDMADSSATNVNFSVGFAVVGSAGTLEMFYRNGSNLSINGGFQAEIGTWYHLAGVFTSTTSREFFINGVSAGTDTTSVTFPTGLDVSTVGRLGDSSPGSYLNSLAAYVRIFSTDLSQTQIQSLMRDPEAVTSNRVWALDLTNSADFGEDTSGNAYDATGTAPSSSDQQPPNIVKVGGSQYFDRTESNYVYIPSGEAGPHDDITSPATFAAWIKSDGTQSGTLVGIVGLGDGLYQMGLDSSGHVRYFINGTSIVGATVVTDGNWHHIACTTNSGRNSHVIYVDGVSDQTSSSTATLPSIASTYIGERGDEGGQPFNGYIAHAQLFSTELSIGEINEIMVNPYSIQRGLEGHYPLDIQYIEGSDMSTNTYDLTDGSPRSPEAEGPPVSL